LELFEDYGLIDMWFGLAWFLKVADWFGVD